MIADGLSVGIYGTIMLGTIVGSSNFGVVGLGESSRAGHGERGINDWATVGPRVDRAPLG